MLVKNHGYRISLVLLLCSVLALLVLTFPLSGARAENPPAKAKAEVAPLPDPDPPLDGGPRGDGNGGGPNDGDPHEFELQPGPADYYHILNLFWYLRIGRVI